MDKIDFETRASLWFESNADSNEETTAKTLCALMYDACNENLSFKDCWEIMLRLQKEHD